MTRNRVSFNTAALQTRGLPTNLVVARPSLDSDGMITDPEAGGTVTDAVFGTRAQLTLPPGVLSEPTDVAIDVFSDPLDIPTPMGFQGPGTHFVNIELTPQPVFPLPAPGLTVVLPCQTFCRQVDSLTFSRWTPQLAIWFRPWVSQELL